MKLVRQYGLRKGDVIAGPSRPANPTKAALMSVESVNGEEPAQRPPVPTSTIRPCIRPSASRSNVMDDAAARLIDLVALIGKGQRGLIVVPARAGKSTVMNQIVRSLKAANHRRCSPDHLVDRRTSRRGHLDGASPR